MDSAVAAYPHPGSHLGKGRAAVPPSPEYPYPHRHPAIGPALPELRPCQKLCANFGKSQPSADYDWLAHRSLSHRDRSASDGRFPKLASLALRRARGKHPGRRPLDADKIAAALSLVKAGLSPTAVAKQLGLGRLTVYRELSRAGIERMAPSV
jgi:hypothetical protein